jgi:hypothetical protein
VLPPASEHELARPAQPPSSRAPSPAASEREPAPAPASPSLQSAPATPSPAPPGGVPEPAPDVLPLSRPGVEPDEDIFKPRREGETPRIDLDAAKKRAVREMAREGSGAPGVLAFPLPIPEQQKTKEAKAMEKAIKPDCRTAYAGMGLLAVPALVASAITDEGCKW